jgi:hypothetical protein
MNLDYQGIMAAMMQENPGSTYEQVGIQRDGMWRNVAYSSAHS